MLSLYYRPDYLTGISKKFNIRYFPRPWETNLRSRFVGFLSIVIMDYHIIVDLNSKYKWKTEFQRYKSPELNNWKLTTGIFEINYSRKTGDKDGLQVF